MPDLNNSFSPESAPLALQCLVTSGSAGPAFRAGKIQPRDTAPGFWIAVKVIAQSNFRRDS